MVSPPQKPSAAQVCFFTRRLLFGFFLNTAQWTRIFRSLLHGAALDETFPSLRFMLKFRRVAAESPGNSAFSTNSTESRPASILPLPSFAAYG